MDDNGAVKRVQDFEESLKAVDTFAFVLPLSHTDAKWK